MKASGPKHHPNKDKPDCATLFHFSAFKCTSREQLLTTTLGVCYVSIIYRWMKQSYSEHLHVYERTEGNTYCGCSAWPDSYYHCCVMLVEFVDRTPALELTRHLVWVQQLERRLNRFSWSAVFERLTECYEEVTLSQSQTGFFETTGSYAHREGFSWNRGVFAVTHFSESGAWGIFPWVPLQEDVVFIPVFTVWLLL